MVERNDYPKIENVILLYMLLVVIMLAVSVPLILYREEFYTNNRYLLAPLINLFSIGIIFAIGFKKSNMKLNDIINSQTLSYHLLLLLIVLSFGLTVVFSEFNNLIRSFYPMPESVLNSMIDFLTSGNIFIVVFSTGIVIPITEEFLFRGLFLNGLLKNHSAVISIITTSFLFTFIHPNPWGMLTYFFIGIVLSWIFLKTKNIIYCIVVHSLYNMWLVIFLKADLIIPGFSDFSNPYRFQPLWLDSLGIVTVSICFYLLNLIIKKKQFSSE